MPVMIQMMIQNQMRIFQTKVSNNKVMKINHLMKNNNKKSKSLAKSLNKTMKSKEVQKDVKHRKEFSKKAFIKKLNKLRCNNK